MLLDFRYELNLEFSDPVEDQYFLFQCVPRDTERQKLVSFRVAAEPDAVITRDTDGLGNHRIYGLIREPHGGFRLRASGVVETTASLYEEYQDPADIGLVRYKVPSANTLPGPALKAFYEACSKDAPDDEYGKLLFYRERVHRAVEYVSGSTDVRTTAEEALRQRKGVCQDHAHVLIALLRMAGIPARYVAGLMSGEGESHGWVEANCRGYWYGADPANDLLVDENYIKFTHGRDSEDCMVSRGIFKNPRASQTMGIAVSVKNKEVIQ